MNKQLYFTRVPRWIQGCCRGLVWRRADGDRPLLTFDDGPHPDTTPWILDELDRMDQGAIFFLIGEQAERYPELMDEIRQRGHQVANHGYQHLRGWQLSVDHFRENVERGAEITGSTLYRPAYGQIGFRQYRAIKNDHQVMMWSVMPGDFIEDIDVKRRMEKIKKVLRPDDIIVLHDNVEHFERMRQMLVMLG